MKNMRSSDSDIESGGEPAADEESTAELNDFFSQVEEIKEAMAQITENIATMKGLYSKLLTATSTEDAQGTTPPLSAPARVRVRVRVRCLSVSCVTRDTR